MHALQMSKPKKLETFAMSGSKITEYSVWQMIAQTPLRKNEHTYVYHWMNVLEF